MKFKLLTLALSCFVFTLSAQKIIDEKVKVRYTRIPNIIMNNIKTYDCKWDAAEIKIDIPGIDTELGYTEQTVKGYLALQGYTYNSENPDIVLTLQSKRLNLPIPKIVNVSSNSSTPNYRAKYKVPADWLINVDGKFSHKINMHDHIGTVEVFFPALTNSYGMPGETISKREALEKYLNENPEKVTKYVSENAVAKILGKTKEVIISELSYKSMVKDTEVHSFKSSKKHDMSTWDEPYEKGIELLNKISMGEEPIKLYQAYKSSFDFWAEQFETNNNDGNKKIISVAANNLVQLLLLVNPEAIKPEYADHCYTGNKSRKEIKSLIEEAKQRQLVNKSNTVDYKQLSLMPPLFGNSYEITYTNSKGEKKSGVIKLSTPFGLNPFENTGYNITIFDKDDVRDEYGKPSDKQKIDLKSVKEYELLGYKYVKLKYSDPTAVSLSGSEAFVEIVLQGKCSLFKTYSMEAGSGSVIGGGLSNNNSSQLAASRKNPQFIIQNTKKPVVVFNYGRVADMMKDCNTVSDKIISGAYGNKEVKKANSKLGKFIQQGSENTIKEDIITSIVKEYNSLM